MTALTEPVTGCQFPGCDRASEKRGYCGKHYQRLRKAGALEPVPAGPKPRPLRERLFSRLVIDSSGCLLWTGKLDRKGYGRIWVNGRWRLVHQVAWELQGGPIPPGLELDHVRARGCTYKNCASIAHLELVTHQENVLRGDSIAASYAARTHCDSGHEFTPDNTYVYPAGGRACRICKRAANLRYNETHRAERAAFTRAWRVRKKAVS
jgi:hypothetical protein